MITSSQKLLMARAGVPSGSAGWLVPIVSRSNDYDYIHFLNSGGEVVGTCQTDGNFLRGANYYRYGNYYYVFYGYTSSSWFKVNLSSFNVVSTGSLNSSFGRGQFSPISDSQLIRVSAPDQKYYIFDMATGTETAYTYTAGDSTAIAQTHATLSFFDSTASGVANVSDQVYWSSANGVSFNSEVNYATLTGTSLGTRSDVSGASNYSRNYALTVDSDYGLMWLFDSDLKRVVPSTSTITSVSPASFTDTYSYSYAAPQAYAMQGCGGAGVTGNVYGSWRASDGAGGYLFSLCSYDPLTSTSPSATQLLTYPGGGYYAYNHPECVLAPLNEAGYVFFAYFDLTSDNVTIKSAIFNGSTQVGSTVTETISTSYTGSTESISSNRGGPGVQSYFGPVLPGSATTEG